MRFSFTKRDSWVTNGTLALHFTNQHCKVIDKVEIVQFFLEIIQELFVIM